MADLLGGSQIYMVQACTPQSFPYPVIFGTRFVNLEAQLVTNFSTAVPEGMYWSHYSNDIAGVTFCNVSLEYTHPGYNDNINTQVWLPIENWNGRLQGSGGGGFQTGLVPSAMAGAVSDGYACVSTNGGHNQEGVDLSWALSSPGNVNWALLQDFASITLGETADIGKAITADFYGRVPAKSYWNGCSMGGRQGLQLAQRYPDAYDGILAAAPAINLPRFVTAEYWPQLVMYEAGEFPAPCEMNAITNAAIEGCDELDGVKDGIVSLPELCNFDAKTLIGKEIDCEDSPEVTKISETAVKVAETAWKGAHGPDGTPLWPGITHEAPLTGSLGLANTDCSGNGCKPAAFAIAGIWVKWFQKKDPTFDLSTLTLQEATDAFHQAHQQYQSIIAANDPDLTPFHRAGGKMITWHGYGDQVIMPNGTRHYYEAVLERDSKARDYYRYFEAPGVYHCWSGPGPYPGTALQKLVEWVEQGKVPDVLPARRLVPEDGSTLERNLCAYPLKQKYKGIGDIHEAESFECV